MPAMTMRREAFSRRDRHSEPIASTSPTSPPAPPAVKKIEAELGPVEVLVNNAGITRDAVLHRMTPEQWGAGDRHQSHLVLQHVPLRDRGHARARLRPHRQYRLDQRPGRAVRPGELRRGEIGHPRLHQGAGAGGRVARRHRQRDRARLYRHRHGARRARQRAGEDRRPHPGRAGSATPRRSRAACCSWSSDEGGFITGSTLSINGGQHMY